MADRAKFDAHREYMAKLGVTSDGPPLLRVDPSGHPDREYTEHIPTCRICEQPLNRYQGPDGEAYYVHSRSWQRYDHDPDMVLVATKDVSEQLCDFCGQSCQPHWAFVGDNVSLNIGNLDQNYGTTWSACEHCAPMVTAGDLNALLDRCLRLSRLTKGDPPDIVAGIRQHMLSLWTAFLPTVRERRYIGPRREPARLSPRMMPKLQLGLIKFWNYPGLLDQLSAGRKAARMTHSIPGVHSGREDKFTVRYAPDDPMPRTVWRNHVQHLAAGLHTADLYWISRDFTQLATMAGQDFDKLIISREELPAPFGFMVYEQPIGEIVRPGGAAAIRAVSWTLVPGGIWVNLYIQGEDADPEIDVEAMRAELGYLMCPNPGSGLAFDTELPAVTGQPYSFLSTIFATWFLMTQPGVAEQNPAPVDKKIARTYQRQYNRRLPDVKLVDLRRRPRRPGTEPETREGHKLTVRVYRRGHWKRQAYGPKHGMRKTIYVSAYIAGPEDAPLKQRPATVKVLR